MAAHKGWVASYMEKAAARAHAARIGGDWVYVWASGIDTWHVFKRETEVK